MSAVGVSAGGAKVVDALSLLALKVAPNVFDLSSGQSHVSIRDQIVRAQLLIRDLCEADLGVKKILVVGAGIAGVTAAIAAAHAEIEVRVVDTQAEAFSLQRAVQSRFVGPFMYEWPSSFFNNQSYPSGHAGLKPEGSPFSPSWSSAAPISAHDLAEQLDTWLAEALLQLTLRPGFWFNADPIEVASAVKEFARQTGVRATWTSTGSRYQAPKITPLPLSLKQSSNGLSWQPFVPDYILLGAGLGTENTHLPNNSSMGLSVSGPKFWANDSLRAPSTINQSTGVFGGGDGALQDVMRALTRFDHPLLMLEHLEKSPTVKALLSNSRDALLAMDQQSRLFNTWTGNAFATLDKDCEALARRLAQKTKVRARVLSSFRQGSGTVFHFVRENHFGKAYLLNRFLVHLIIACREKMAGKLKGYMDYECHFGAQADQSHTPHSGYRYQVTVTHSADFIYRNATGHRAIPKGGHVFDLHEVAVRFGLEKGSTPGAQLISLSGLDCNTRTLLAQIPLPFTSLR